MYLGGRIDPATGARWTDDATTSINASDLTTHAVIVGMTGSGKTGLGVVLIEEALTSGVPALLIDPKGGDACVIDIDSLVVPGLAPPTVLGTPGYIAPEVVAGKKLPSIETDQHASMR